MKNLFQKLEGAQTGRSTTLTAKDFFRDNNPKGYFTKQEFIDYATGLVRDEPNQFIDFIEQFQNGARLNSKLQIRNDRSGRQYVWVEFNYARASRGYKVIVSCDILRFIQEYATGQINVDFTTEELSIEAVND